MKSYPSIPYLSKEILDEKVHVFNKIDGSNLRAEWSHKRGFYKFGTKNVMIDTSTPIFGEGIIIFLNKYANELDKVFRNKYKKLESAVVFCEFYGENSFAGQHEESDKKDIVLFDVSLYKKGIIPPAEFVSNFGHLHIAELIEITEFNQELIDKIKVHPTLKEGVVCKGLIKTKKDKDILFMTKLKTTKWLEAVRAKLGEKRYQEEFK